LPDSDPGRREQFRLGSGWILVAGLLFAAMGVFVKLAADYHGAAELVFYRSLLGMLAVLGTLAASRRGLRSLVTTHGYTHVARGLTGFAALMLFFYAIAGLPLSTATTLNYTSPLFLALFTVWLLGERPDWRLTAGLLIGFVAIALLLKPTFGQGLSGEGLAGLASGMFAGLAYINVRRLGLLGEPEWRIVFYFTLVSSLGAAVWMVFGTVRPITPVSGVLILAIGVTATLAQLAMTRAYRLGRTLVVGTLAYSTVVFSSLFQLLVWGVELDATQWVAVGLVCLSGMAALRYGPHEKLQ
jgi:drug/metabolite transporter (DMT)-like permease